MMRETHFIGTHYATGEPQAKSLTVNARKSPLHEFVCVHDEFRIGIGTEFVEV
jgi:hypothetical protein